MRTVRYTGEAQAELLHEIGFYAAITASLGDRFDKTVRAAVALVATHPELGSPHGHGTRRVVLKKFPFDIVYLHSDAEVVVLAIAAHRRKPGYWRRRG